jgi:hypothetical protein
MLVTSIPHTPSAVPAAPRRRRPEAGDGGGLAVPPGRTAPAPGGCGLAFDELGGPLLAVCGLHGGAGASTLAHAIAATAAHESLAAVLLCETAASSTDIARLARCGSPLTLTELANARAVGVAPGGGTLARAGRLRVIAAAKPELAPDALPDAVPGFLHSARALHGLTVVDAGPLRAAGAREILTVATHIAWVMSARDDIVDVADALLASTLIPPSAARRVLVARGCPRRAGSTPARGAARRLRDVAEAHCDRLILMPDQAPGFALTSRAVRSVLTALAGLLTSSP